ncbi:DUF4097 family beta strand repeat-containing protein [Staphylococcus massiliensis]|uniref:DUF4097 family beta strand repeat-containing protein n=1 Tax=Staphylococcus massiliensis TaxID=555791 RepID=UPI001EDFC68A|nr:DUF4097 family beta strand repeat-containing protein [Staphylococcus massiliensis]MCG3411608.1 DUF4097 domain-containing protein [Staphylococcus massiliensis]
MRKYLKILLIIGLIITVVFGALTFYEVKKMSEDHGVTKKKSKSFDEPIHGLDIDTISADVEIRKGDRFKVETMLNDKVTKFSTKVEDKTLKVEEDSSFHVEFDIFGKTNRNKVIVTVPETELEKLKLESDSGDVKIKGIRSKMSEIDVDSGRVTSEHNKLGNSLIHIDTGDFISKKTTYTRLDTYTNTGTIRIEDMTPDIYASAETDTGEIDITYDELPQNTQFDARSGVGDVSFENDALKDRRSGDGKYLFKLVADTGEIRIK